MRRAEYAITFFFLIFLLIPQHSNGDVIHGSAELYQNQGWDFSDSCYVSMYTADMVIFHGLDSNFVPHEAVITLYGGCLSDSAYNELTIAPADPLNYVQELGIYLHQCYVIITEEGHYVKCQISWGSSAYIIEYTYQPDGTRWLVDEIGVDHSTWGRIKALFR
ncbi:MAG: hypothetical protein JSV33_10445 [bacterium]|nr:MAG: hypothetical protein JSV33_10445 [bacterium]